MKYLIVFAMAGLFVFGCNEKSSTEAGIQDSKTNTVKNVVEIDPCAECDSIYNAFPKDSFEFEKLYGYPNGSRQFEVQEDLIRHFRCLEKSFDYQKLIETVKLGSEIKFDVDGPTFLRHYLTEYLMTNTKETYKLYTEMACESFAEHVAFLYKGVENTNFTERICKYLLTFDSENICKAKVVKEYCEKDFSIQNH